MTLVRPCTVPGLGEQDAAGRAGEPFNLDQAQRSRLQGDRPLAAEFFSPPLPLCQDLGMAGFGRGKTALGPGDFVFEFVVDAADLVVDPLEQRGQGQRCSRPCAQWTTASALATASWYCASETDSGTPG